MIRESGLQICCSEQRVYVASKDSIIPGDSKTECSIKKRDGSSALLWWNNRRLILGSGLCKREGVWLLSEHIEATEGLARRDPLQTMLTRRPFIMVERNGNTSLHITASSPSRVILRSMRAFGGCCRIKRKWCLSAPRLLSAGSWTNRTVTTKPARLQLRHFMNWPWTTPVVDLGATYILTGKSTWNRIYGPA